MTGGPARVLFLAGGIAPSGPVHRAGSLIRYLARVTDVRLASLLSPRSTTRFELTDAETDLDGTVISYDELDDWDVVFAEGGTGLVLGQLLAPEVLDWIRRGNQFIVADLSAGRAGRDEVGRIADEILRAVGVGPIHKVDGMGRLPVPRGDEFSADMINVRSEVLQYNLHAASPGGVYSIEDPDRDHRGRTIIPSNQAVLDIDDEWLRAPWRAIASLLVLEPIELRGATSAVHALGRLPNGVTVIDGMEVPDYGHMWAAVVDHGAGHIALLGAGVASDDLVDENLDNARWITALIETLQQRSREHATFTSKRPINPQSAVGDLLDAPESGTLERKDDFTSKKGGDDTQIDIFNVARAVASMANTEGGVVIVGQRDDLTLVEPATLLARLKARNADAFERAMQERLENCMDAAYAALSVDFSWLQRDGRSVLAIRVPRSPVPVHLKLSKGGRPSAIFVRRGNSSRQLEGIELTTWARARER